MDRLISNVGESIYEWMFTKPDQNKMTALGKLAAALFGTSTIVNGLSCVPTGPASMQVIINPGEIYSQANLEASVCGTLPADTTHQILKQGILLDAFTTAAGALAAPGTAGQSINYLIQAQYADSDVSIDPTTGNTPVVLQFYNASNPTQPWSGPGGNGQTSTTFRKGVVSLQVKAGIAATTGTQTTPAPDAGYTGLWVVTVANGQTTITSASIAQAANAPILPTDLLHAIQQNALTTAVDTGTANAYAVSYNPPITALKDGMVLWFKAANPNSGASTLNVNGLGPQPLIGGAHSALQGGEIVAGGKSQAVYRADISSFVLLECTGGALQVAPAVQSQQAIPLSQLQAATGASGSSSFRNKLANGWAYIAQDAVRSLSTSPQYGLVDMVSGWASGGAVSAGTITQDTAAPVGRTGYAFKLAGVTLTGAGQVSWRYRMDSANALEFRNQIAQFQIAVQHDVGSAINYTALVRKPTAVDNFSSTTVIGTSSAVSVPSGTPTPLVPFPNGLALGDVSNGLEIEVQAACGAVTNKNFWFTEWQLEEGAVTTKFEFRPISTDISACERVFQKIGFDAQTYTLGMRGNAAAANSQYMSLFYRTKMRGIPAASAVGSWAVSNCSQPIISASSNNSVLLITTAAAPGDFYFLLASAATGVILDSRL